jgi:hypothetical protein
MVGLELGCIAPSRLLGWRSKVSRAERVKTMIEGGASGGKGSNHPPICLENQLRGEGMMFIALIIGDS